MWESKAWDTLNLAMSLIVITVFTFFLWSALTRIEANQAQSAKQVDSQFSNLERRILERMEKPERWTDKNESLLTP